MTSNKKIRVGDLQLRILQILWESSPSTVGHVYEKLGGRWAYTTVATMLRKMETRGLVTSQKQDRRLVYSPSVTRERVTQSMIDDVVDRLFGGRLVSAVSHLLEARDVSAEELAELEKLLRRYKEHLKQNRDDD